MFLVETATALAVLLVSFGLQRRAASASALCIGSALTLVAAGASTLMLAELVSRGAAQPGLGSDLRVKLRCYGLMNMALLPGLAGGALARQSRVSAQYLPSLSRALAWALCASLAGTLVAGALLWHLTDAAIASFTDTHLQTITRIDPLISAAFRWSSTLALTSITVLILLALGSLLYRALSKISANAA